MTARILYLIGDLRLGGAQRQLVYLAKHLDRAKFEPIVGCLSTNAPLAQELRLAAVEVIILPQVMRPDVTRFWRVSQLVKRYQPDLLHAYLFAANCWARTAGLIHHLPVIVSERSALVRRSPGERLVNRFLARFTTMLIANSHAGANFAIQQREISPQRLRVVHNGIDLAPYQNPDIGRLIRREFEINHGQPVVGIVGRMVPAKDHDTFFQAMALVVKQFPDVRILCVGEGPRQQALQESVVELGLEPHVIFTGSRTDVPAIMFALDLLVLSSRWEGFPNVVMEAMAAARPVVATDVGDVNELVAHQQSGLLVEPSDPKSMAQAILDLLQDRPRLVEMGRQGRICIEREFTHDQMVTATCAIYRQILEQREA